MIDPNDYPGMRRTDEFDVKKLCKCSVCLSIDPPELHRTDEFNDKNSCKCSVCFSIEDQYQKLMIGP